MTDCDRAARSDRVADGFAQPRFDGGFVVDVIEEHAAAGAGDAAFARDRFADARAAGTRIDEEAAVARQHVGDVAHHARVLGGEAALVVVHAARLRQFGQVAGEFAANRRIVHGRRDRSRPRIAAGDRLHRQVEHNALARGARIARDRAPEAHVRQDGERERKRQRDERTLRVGPLAAIIDDDR